MNEFESSTTTAAEFLAQITARGASLSVDPDGMLQLYGTSRLLSPSLADQLIEHRSELLEMLRRDKPYLVSCEVCGCDQFEDTEIHGGRSVRRHCAVCRRVMGYPHWAPRPGDVEDEQ